MSIEVRNVTKYYGAQKALSGVSFTVPSGEVVGFLGPNGAGKSTMMKIITGYLPPDEGIALINGIDIRTAPVDVKRHIGYLPENNPLYPEMYVKEYLNYVAGLYRMGKSAKKRIEEIILITGLQQEQKKKIEALSKGYRQRVGLAQALIHDPDVLILDEPTSGLDPNQIIEIRDLVKTLGQKKTILLSTHIMQEVEAVCNRVIIIHKGKIVTDMQGGNIRQPKKGEETSILVEFNGDPNLQELQKVEGIRQIVAENHAGKYIFHIHCVKDLREEIFRYAVKHELAVLSLTITDQKLEDVFRDLTREQE